MSKGHFLLLIAVFIAGTLQAQTSVPNMMQTSLTKIKASSQDGRVIERTFSDVIFKDDSAGTNCWFYHRMSASNTYRIDAFAPGESISAMYVYVYYKDNNDKWQLATSNSSTSNDVSLRFSPQVSRFYAVMVKGTLRANISNALFNLIIERE